MASFMILVTSVKIAFLHVMTFNFRSYQDGSNLQKNKTRFSFILLLILFTALGCDIFAQVTISQFLVFFRNTSGFRQFQISNRKWGKNNGKLDFGQNRDPRDTLLGDWQTDFFYKITT